MPFRWLAYWNGQQKIWILNCFLFASNRESLREPLHRGPLHFEAHLEHEGSNSEVPKGLDTQLLAVTN